MDGYEFVVVLGADYNAILFRLLYYLGNLNESHSEISVAFVVDKSDVGAYNNYSTKLLGDMR